MNRVWHWVLICVWLGFALDMTGAAAAATTNVLVWNKAKDRVDADVRGWELFGLLERIASETGWQVYVEPDSGHKASVKFDDLPSGEALRLLLGDLNFALVPQTNNNSRLYVFRTAMQNATRQVRPVAGKDLRAAQPKRVPNQLIVRLKPGADIDAWARLLNAKVIGRIPELDAYLLEFEDAAAAEAARLQLGNGSDVAAVDYNYYLDPPEASRGLLGASTPPLSLQLKPPGDSGRVIVGLVDTAVQPLGGQLDAFLLKQISVAGDALLASTTPTHGTSMAETILRSLEIVTKGNTSVQILPVDVYGPNAETTSWNVALGIVQAVNGGANVINLSLGGGGDSTVLRDLVKSVSDRGIPIFAAAGNEPVATPFFPAAYPEVTAVTARGDGPSPSGQVTIAPYANHGSFVDVAAPDASLIYFDDRPWYVRGTSAAAAYTSGMAAGLAETTRKSWADVLNIVQRNFPVP
jgi:hypothetical protein